MSVIKSSPNQHVGSKTITKDMWRATCITALWLCSVIISGNLELGKYQSRLNCCCCCSAYSREPFRPIHWESAYIEKARTHKCVFSVCGQTVRRTDRHMHSALYFSFPNKMGSALCASLKITLPKSVCLCQILFFGYQEFRSCVSFIHPVAARWLKDTW